MTLVAGIDSSTQSCKVVIRDAATGATVRTGRAPHPTGTEVDPNAWWDALRTAICDAGGFSDVQAVAIAGQQHGMVVLDAEGHVIRPALLWNDTRSAQAALDLIDEVGAEDFATRTGSVPVASFTLTKLRWLRDAEPENAARIAAVALPHDWLTWRIRGYGPADSSPLGPKLDALVTDRSDASGTSYWNPATGDYDRDLLARALRLPAAEPHDHVAAQPAHSDAHVSTEKSGVPGLPILPSVLQPHQTAGVTPQTTTDPELPTDEPAEARGNRFRGGNGFGSVDGFGSVWPEHAVRVGAGMGDNAAAALGLGAGPGDVVISLGTSGTVFAVTERPVADASGTVAGFADAGGAYLPLIATLNAARTLDSIAALLGVDHDGLGALAVTAAPGSDGLVLVPWFEGERTPNRPDATATLSGMTLSSTTRPNLARASIEGMLCGLAAGLDAVRELGVTVNRLLLIGGSAQNPAVSAIAAQVFNAPIIVPEPGEYVAAGAAVQASWALTGQRPQWKVALASSTAADFQPIIRSQYAWATSEL